MTQIVFGSNASPLNANLDANFNDCYGLLNLFTTPVYTGTGTKYTVDAGGNFSFSGNLCGASTAGAYTIGANPLATVTTGAYMQLYGSANATPNIISFGSANTEKFRLDGAGNVIVGSNSSNPNPGIALIPTGVVVIGNNAQASGWAFANFNRSAVTVGSITQSGTTAVLYNTTSDGRLKKNVQDASEAGSIIDAIKVRSFDWRAADNEHVAHGFIAQELVLVAPQAVKVGDSGEKIIDTWAVDPSKLVALLIREVQSLRARIAALEESRCAP